MIKAEQLREFRPIYKYSDGATITLESIKEEIEKEANNMGIRICIEEGTVKSGGVFNSSVENCIVLSHPEHRTDFYNVCIRIQRQGDVAFIYCNDFGTSKNDVKTSSVEGAIKGGSLGVIGSTIVHKMFGPKKAAQEFEKNYYSCLMEILDEVIS